MRRRPIAAILGATTAVALTAGYVVVDVYDIVPGVLTLSEAANPSDAPKMPTVNVPEASAAHLRTGQNVNSVALQEAWSALAAAAEEGKWTTWAMVIDPDTGQTLLSENADAAHTPASVTKVLAAFTALTHLDPAARLATGTSHVGSDVYLWGQGDLLLGPGAGDASKTNGHAGLADLAVETAAALSQQGLTEITLHTPGPLFDGPDYQMAWVTHEVGEYEGRMAPLAIDAGRVGGNIADYFEDPTQVAAQILTDQLRENGIEVTWGDQAAVPPTAVELARVESATVADQLRFMVRNSDNTLADQYCHLAATAVGVPSTFQGTADLVAATLSGAGVPTDKLYLEDCSGLSFDDRIVPATLVGVLQVAYADRDGKRADLLRMLPWAGGYGTLDLRMDEGPALGNVQAKTGSLATVAALAGVVSTSSGQTLIFAVGTDHVPDDAAWLTRPHLDSFVEALAALP